MNESSLMFMERGIEVCFSDRKKVVVDYEVKEEIKKYIWEAGNSLYHRVTRRNGTLWFDRDFIMAPTSIGYKLEQIMNDILKD